MIRRALLLVAVGLAAALALPPLWYAAFREPVPELPPPGRRVEVAPKPRERVEPTLSAIDRDLAAETGLAGIAVQAGHCLIAERAEAIAAADRAGLFVIGVAGR